MVLELLFLYAILLIAAIALSEVAADHEFWWEKRKSAEGSKTSPNTAFLLPSLEVEEKYTWKSKKQLAYGWGDYLPQTLAAYGAALQSQRHARSRRELVIQQIFKVLRLIGIRNKRHELKLLKLRRQEMAIERALARYMSEG